VYRYAGSGCVQQEKCSTEIKRAKEREKESNIIFMSRARVFYGSDSDNHCKKLISMQANVREHNKLREKSKISRQIVQKAEREHKDDRGRERARLPGDNRGAGKRKCKAAPRPGTREMREAISRGRRARVIGQRRAPPLLLLLLLLLGNAPSAGRATGARRGTARRDAARRGAARLDATRRGVYTSLRRDAVGSLSLARTDRGERVAGYA